MDAAEAATHCLKGVETLTSGMKSTGMISTSDACRSCLYGLFGTGAGEIAAEANKYAAKHGDRRPDRDPKCFHAAQFELPCPEWSSAAGSLALR